MKIIKHGFYIIKDKFFEDFPDPYLKGNKEENRPHYFCFKVDDSDIYWIIPASQRVEKYEKIINDKEMKFGTCDILHILNIANKKNVLLIQDIFPISEDYILREYTINNIHLKLLDSKEIGVIEAKVNKVLALLRKGVKFVYTQPNVFLIEKQLKEKLSILETEELASAISEKSIENK